MLLLRVFILFLKYTDLVQRGNRFYSFSISWVVGSIDTNLKSLSVFKLKNTVSSIVFVLYGGALQVATIFFEPIGSLVDLGKTNFRPSDPLFN